MEHFVKAVNEIDTSSQLWTAFISSLDGLKQGNFLPLIVLMINVPYWQEPRPNALPAACFAFFILHLIIFG